MVLLGAALQELKIMQSKLARLNQLRQDTFNVLEKKPVEVAYDAVSKEIDDLIQSIRILKVRIAKTNSICQATVEGHEIPLQELIIMIGDIRSELNQLECLKPQGAVYLGGQAVEYIPQKKQYEMAAIISTLEERKANLDKILQAANWKIELVL